MFASKKIRQKLVSCIAITSLLVSLLPLTASANLTDINSSPYKTAIEFLNFNNVVKGDDGLNTYRPQDDINRAEFAKVAILTLGITTGEYSNGCFEDVPGGQWFTSTVCEAKQRGIVTGPGDGRVYLPADPITIEEAITITCRALEWNTANNGDIKYAPSGQWFTDCVNYAKKHNLIPYLGSQYQTGQAITREQFAETVYRSVLEQQVFGKLPHLETPTENSTPDQATPNETPDEDVVPDEADPTSEPELDPDQINTTAVDSDKEYATDTFANIELDNSFPNTFFQDEIYMFSGEITSGNHDSMFLFYFPKNNQSALKTVAADVNGSDDFDLPFHFDLTPGDYYIGMIPGTSGNSVIAEITVTNSLPTETTTLSTPSKPSSTDINFTNDQTTITFESNNDTAIHKIDFTQSSRTITYYSRQANIEIPITYADFANFNTNSTTLSVKSSRLDEFNQPTARSAWSSSTQTTFKPTNHYYSEIASYLSQVSIPNFLEDNIRVSARTSEPLSGTLSIITPAGTVTEKTSYSQGISAGSNFQFTYNVSNLTSGTYIFEVNDLNGLAAINHPIYPRNTIPLIPDYFDLNEPELNTSSTVNLSSDRQQLLNLVNQKRNEVGLDNVALDTALNSVAQDHTDDMVARDYFAHVNPDGNSPNDRSQAAGIETPVGENIVKTVSVEQGHELLIRSAIHLQNILDPYWSRVGIGITKDSDGFYYIAQEFSLQADEAIVKMLATINDERSTDITSSDDLSTAAQTWSEKMIAEDFFATNNGDEDISEYIDPDRTYADIKGLVLRTSQLDQAVTNIIDNTTITDAEWQYVGIGIDVEDGIFYITVLYGQS